MNKTSAAEETLQYASQDLPIQNPMLTFLSASIIIWFCQFLWSRRKLYLYSFKVPGPISFPFIGTTYKFVFHSSGSDIFDVISRAQDVYPRLFKMWFGTRLVYFLAQPNDFEKILISQRTVHKSRFLYSVMEDFFGHGLLTAPVYQWKPNRKMIAPTFNTQILNSFVDTFSKKSSILVKEIEKVMDQESTNWYQIVSRCTFDAICETTMGVNMDTQTNRKIDLAPDISRLLEIGNYKVFKIWYQLPIRSLVWKLSPLKQEYQKLSQKYYNFTDELIKEKEMNRKEEKRRVMYDINTEKEKGVKKQILLDMLLENSKFTPEQMRSEVDTFVGVGMDTSALAVCGVFTCLGVHQEIQQKLYEEVMEVIGPNKSIESDDLTKLKYTERVIQETLRIFPIGAAFAREIKEDTPLDDDLILPAGSHVMLNVFSLHRNPKIWENPLKFNPDRFLQEEVNKRHPFAYVPFSKGPRNCVGHRYAMMNMKTIIANVLRNFRVYTAYKSLEEIELEVQLLLKFKKGYQLSFKHR